MTQERDQRFKLSQLDLLDAFQLEDSKVSNYKSSSGESLGTEESMPSTASNSCLSSPEILLIIDTETTGLDPFKNKCIEVGAILFNVSKRAVLAQVSFLLPVGSNEAESVNRISAEVSRIPQPWEQGLVYFSSLVDAADLLVAHNSSFDMQWFGNSPLPEIIKPWLCTMEDIIWPKERNLRSRPSVRDLALAYEIPVWSAHRALTDCIYLSEVFSRCEDLEKLLQEGLEPKRLMRAQVSYDQRQLARQAGFRWNDPVKGAWTRRLSDRQASLLGFPVITIEPENNIEVP